jgi:hypothetical protein
MAETGETRPPSLGATFHVHTLLWETETRGSGLGVKAEELSLLRPRKRQMRETAEPAYRTCDRLAAREDSLDDIGGQEGES